MRAAVWHGPGDVRVEDVPDAAVERPTDAVVRVGAAAVCGSDLRVYRGTDAPSAGQVMGRELVGVVEAVGSDVHGVRPGDPVVAASEWACGTCRACRGGRRLSCPDGGRFGEDGAPGAQADAVRVPYADSTLVRLWDGFDPEDHTRTALALPQVMASGWHAATCGDVTYGRTVAVVGDGATALCAVLAAARMGAERVVALVHHPERQKIARRFSATDVVGERGDEAVDRVLGLTGGRGVDVVLDCVGTEGSWDTTRRLVRDGCTVGHIGAPVGAAGLPLAPLEDRGVTVRGGLAPTGAYLPDLVARVAAGRLEPSAVLTSTVKLDEVADAYADMDARRTVKAAVVV